MSKLRPGISLCMIVKDEAHNLPRCLAAVKNHVDQLIVADTGSSDRSVDIAREYGAEIHHFTWCDDFSAARNFSLAPAQCEWIMCLDADEEVHFSAEALRETVASAEADGIETIYLKLTDRDHQGKCCVSYYQPRLWRNGRQVRFVNAIHNALLTRQPERKTELEVYHYGYKALTEDSFKRKRERNFRIFLREFEKNPADTRLGWELAREYCVINDFSRALPTIEHAIAEFRRQFPGRSLEVNMYDIRIRALMGMQRQEEAMALAGEAMTVWPEQPRFPLVRLKMAFESRQWEEARVEFGIYAELLRRFRNREILQDELTLFGVNEYPSALKAAAISSAFLERSDEVGERLLELYDEDADLSVDTLAAVSGKLPVALLLELLRTMIGRRKTDMLRELVIAVSGQLSSAQLDALRFFTTELQNWPNQPK